MVYYCEACAVVEVDRPRMMCVDCAGSLNATGWVQATAFEACEHPGDVVWILGKPFRRREALPSALTDADHQAHLEAFEPLGSGFKGSLQGCEVFMPELDATVPLEGCPQNHGNRPPEQMPGPVNEWNRPPFGGE